LRRPCLRYPPRRRISTASCAAFGPDGTTSFSLIQTASDAGNADALVFFLFDLLYIDGEAIGPAPLRDRKGRLQELLASIPAPLQYSDHQIGRGPEFYAGACEMGLEGIVSR
jgi:bifunctional non-homologous end joining protein LigD